MGTIIVATDGSDAAAKAAASGFELAGQTGDVVTIVVVREPIPASLGLPFAYYSQEFLDEYQARAEKILDAAEDQARSAGLTPEGIVVTGEATREICKLAQERGADDRSRRPRLGRDPLTRSGKHGNRSAPPRSLSGAVWASRVSDSGGLHLRRLGPLEFKRQ